MRKQNFIQEYCRSLANRIAAKANEFLNKAINANSEFEFNNHKANVIKEYMLNSPLVLFTVLYFLILIVDAILMRPIIEIVVSHGFKMDSQLSLYLFMFIYILLVAGLTIGLAYGFAKLVDPKLRAIQVELETVSRPGIVKPVIEADIRANENWERILGLIFGVLLFTLLISLSLYRNYVVNDYQIKFESPNDWLNIIIPIALGVALAFFGIYKDIVVKLLRLSYNTEKSEKHRDRCQDKANDLVRQALELDSEAIKRNESIPYSADLLEVKRRYEEDHLISPDRYTHINQVEVRLTANKVPVSNIQLTATTGDNSTIYKTTDNNGCATLSWSTRADFIYNLKIKGYDVNSSRFFDKDIISINLEDFIIDLASKNSDNTNLKDIVFKRFLSNEDNI